MALNQHGHEVLDSTPIARPVRLTARPSTLDEMKQLLRIVSREAELNGQETFEEAEDFNVGEDPDPLSRWEIPTDEQLQDFVETLQAERERRAAVDSRKAAPGVSQGASGGPLPVGTAPVPAPAVPAPAMANQGGKQNPSP